MKRIMIALVAALAGLALAFVPSSSHPAHATTVPDNYDITHMAPNVHSFTVACDPPGGGTNYDFPSLYYGETSNQVTPGWGCDYFSVGWGARILYQSDVTGTKYWTKCGEDENGLNIGYGLAHVGNPVHLLLAARYPDAPAQTCTG